MGDRNRVRCRGSLRLYGGCKVCRREMGWCVERGGVRTELRGGLPSPVRTGGTFLRTPASGHRSVDDTRFLSPSSEFDQQAKRMRYFATDHADDATADAYRIRTPVRQPGQPDHCALVLHMARIKAERVPYRRHREYARLYR